MDVRLFASDIDGTILGNPESASRFRDAWRELATANRPVLCYVTGRLVDDVLRLVDADELPRPDYVLGGVGTQIWEASRNGKELCTPRALGVRIACSTTTKNSGGEPGHAWFVCWRSVRSRRACCRPPCTSRSSRSI